MQRRVGRGLSPPAYLPAAILAMTLAAAGPAAPAALASSTPLLEPLSDGSAVALPAVDASVPSPAEFLGYALGGRFTHHERIVAYLDHLAASSERVSIWQYGSTYEGRPLKLAAISSPRNLARLEAIRGELAALAGGADTEAELDRVLASAPVVVWLAYGVHGNEASSAEAAMAAAYVFAAGQDDWSELLDNAVVLIDPLCNPDGRERYVHFYETRRGRVPDPLPESAEHREPWPGGRQNHYLVDLNRDWTWLSQQETQARVAEYRRWEPHVYVDFHEMSPRSSYFFPPSAEPIHPAIAAGSVGWLETFGRANAEAFDDRGWVYYVGENFDLFYPGYGDSYPSLRGAIGMTYEMAGHGRAGQAYRRPDGTVLTLADRIARHLTTSIATARTAIRNRSDLLRDFSASRRARGPERTYLWRPDQPEAAAAAELLAAHGVQVGALAEPARLRTAPLAATASDATDSTDATEARRFPAGTYAVSTQQPLGALVRTLMERDAAMSQRFLDEQRRRIEQNRSTEFFDITAWSLPLAFNVETWVSGEAVASAPISPASGTVRGEGELGVLIPPQGLDSYRLLAALQREDIVFRLAVGAFELAGAEYPNGTVFVPYRGNDEGLDTQLAGLTEELGVSAVRIATGYAEGGNSLGSDDMVPVRPARIGLLAGDGVSPTSFGFLWHLMDQQIALDHHRLDTGSFDRVDLSAFDALVLPSGSLDEEAAKKLEDWLRAGGTLIAVGRAVSWLRNRKVSRLKAWQPPEDGGGRNEVTELTPERRSLYTPGAVLGTRTRSEHPLAAGIQRSPAAIFSGRTVLLPTGDPRRDLLVAAKEDPVVAGFAWPEAEERLQGSLLVGVEGVGAGTLISFSQDPDFRLFWRGTAPFFLNAVMFGPSLAESGHLR